MSKYEKINTGPNTPGDQKKKILKFDVNELFSDKNINKNNLYN